MGHERRIARRTDASRVRRMREIIKLEARSLASRKNVGLRSASSATTFRAPLGFARKSGIRCKIYGTG